MLTAISSITPLVALIGGSGFIGTAIAEKFAAAGWRIIAVGRNPDNARHLKPLGDLGQIDSRRADVRIPATLAPALQGANAVINLAGILEQRGGQKYDAIHVAGARAVAEAARAVGARSLVHISALSADSRSPYAYARSKGLGEEAVHATFPDASIIRPGIAYGPRDNFTNRLADIIATTPTPVMPVIAAEARLQPVFVHDIAAAVFQIVTAENKPDGSRITEIAGPEIFTMREIIAWLADFLGKERPLVDTPDVWARLLTRFSFLPGAPITADQLEMLQHNNIASGNYPGLAELGITPATFATTVSSWLVRYRAGGRFAALA